ncbi:MAG: hypothetical protein OEX22_12705 [Cyclobacteriaceae bacterium]|nr:hypothetical protein [Cyclobacteriaceae bacterium]
MRAVVFFSILLIILSNCGHNEELALDCSLAPIDLKVSEVVMTSCGKNIGEIHVEAVGGNGAFTFSLDEVNYQTEPFFTNLAAGQYTIYVLDKVNCSAQVNASISDNGNVSISNIIIQNADCGQTNGTLSVEAIGGNGVFSYSINNGTLQSEALFSQLSTGVYEVKVEDNTGCTTTSSATIEYNNPIIVDNVILVNAGCGSSIGSISVNVSGGDGAYSYSIDGVNYQLSTIFSGLEKGMYTVTIKDNSSCVSFIDVDLLSGVSFQQSVKSIIDTNCAVSGCHVSGGGRKDFSQISEIQANSADIKTRIISGNMPKNGSLTQNEINLIVCWIDDGAINN